MNIIKGVSVMPCLALHTLASALPYISGNTDGNVPVNLANRYVAYLVQ